MIFSVFCIIPAKDIKTQKCCNLQQFVAFEKLKIVREMCQKGVFFPILRYPQNGEVGGMLVETSMNDPNSIQTALAAVFRGRGRRVGGSALHLEL